MFLFGGIVAVFAAAMLSRDISAWWKLLLLDACMIVPVAGFVILLRSQNRWSALPHNRWSHTAVISTAETEKKVKKKKTA